MFRRSIISILLVGIVVFAGFSHVSAQTTAPVTGRVELVKADGTREPVNGAVIDVFRMDIKSGHPSTKTNKKGEFYFAGFLLGGEYTLSVSAPGTSPTVYPGVKAGQENIVIEMSPGDGKKWTEAEARSAASGAKAAAAGGDTGETAEEKAARAEIEKKNAEILAKNAAIEQGDAIARKSGEEGFAALKAENYDLAIAKFNEGITAVPDYVGSTPILLNGKINSLKSKGHKIYREGGASQDVTFRKAKYDEANKLFDEALADFKTAMAIIQKAEPSADANEQNRRTSLKNNLYSLAMELHRLKAVSQIDTTKTADAKALITEYIAFETDPAKKMSAQMMLGDIMRNTGDFTQAIEAYRAVLVDKPDHPEAMASLGLSLVADGAAQTPQDKDKMQEGLNYMQKYTEIAPVSATDTAQVKELKESVKDTVEYLKSEKMVPQKVTTPKAGAKKRS